jgi:hypothetical protein
MVFESTWNRGPASRGPVQTGGWITSGFMAILLSIKEGLAKKAVIHRNKGQTISVASRSYNHVQ